MAAHSTLEFLIDLAVSKSDAAAAGLGKAIRVSEDGSNKLSLLRQYRDNYVANFQTSMASGLTASAYRNYQSFLAKLEQAIAGQDGIVAGLERKITKERSAWQESERQRNRYRMLQDRAAQKVYNTAQQREQKAMDEHAARQLFYRR